MAKKLERQLGLFPLLSLAMGSMLASGLFILPGIAGGITGPSACLAYVLAGLAMVPSAFSKAELATAMPVSGGAYIFVDRSLGPVFGTISGLGNWAVVCLKSAFALAGLAAYLSLFTDASPKVVAIIIGLFLLGLNFIGVKKASGFQTIIVFITLVTLLLLIVGGAGIMETRRLEPFFAEGAVGFGIAINLVFVSYAGVTKVASFAEEIKNPEKNLPLGILLALGIMVVIYGVLTFVLYATVDMSSLKGSTVPLALLGEALIGNTGKIAIGVVAVISLTSMANSGILSCSRYPFAMARENLIPSVFSKLHPRFLTPWLSVLVTGGVLISLLLFFNITKIAKMASAFQLLMVIMVDLSVIILRKTDSDLYQPKFIAPFFPYLQIVSISCCMTMLYFVSETSLIAILVTFFIGIAWFLGYSKRRVARAGAIQNLIKSMKAKESNDELNQKISTNSPDLLVAISSDLKHLDSYLQVGEAIIGKGCIQVLKVLEAPAQTFLTTVVQDDLEYDVVKRKIDEQKLQGFTFGLDEIATRGAIPSIFSYAESGDVEWIVKSWEKTSGFSTLWHRVTHTGHEQTPRNLVLYKDMGFTQYKKIMVLASPGPYDSAVVSLANRIATFFKGEITFVRILPPSATEQTEENIRLYFEQLIENVDVPTEIRLLRYTNPISAIHSISSQYDLLVDGACPEINLKNIVFDSFENRVIEASLCSALQLRLPTGRLDGLGKDNKEFVFTEYLLEDHCIDNVDVSGKEELFMYLSKLFDKDEAVFTDKEIDVRLWKRERIQNTWVGDDTAMPHAVINRCEKTILAVLRLAEPIDYQNGKMVRHIFATLGPARERNVHLSIISRISSLIMEGGLLENFEKTGDLMKALVDTDSQYLSNKQKKKSE